MFWASCVCECVCFPLGVRLCSLIYLAPLHSKRWLTHGHTEPGTHQHTTQWMPGISQSWMNLNWVPSEMWRTGTWSLKLELPVAWSKEDTRILFLNLFRTCTQTCIPNLPAPKSLSLSLSQTGAVVVDLPYFDVSLSFFLSLFFSHQFVCLAQRYHLCRIKIVDMTRIDVYSNELTIVPFF